MKTTKKIHTEKLQRYFSDVNTSWGNQDYERTEPEDPIYNEAISLYSAFFGI